MTNLLFGMSAVLVFSFSGCQTRSYEGQLVKWTLLDRAGNSYEIAAVRLNRDCLSSREIQLGAGIGPAKLVNDSGTVIAYSSLRENYAGPWRGRLDRGPLISAQGTAVAGPGLADSHPDLPAEDGLRLRLSDAELQKLLKE